jgi:CheY-like chemotaxis protein
VTGADADTGDPTDSASDEARVEVLLVDDESWLASTATLLEHRRERFVVRTATDLAGAVDAYAESEPDCVVSDFQLRVDTGLDLLTEVRSRGSHRPFVLVTGRSRETVPLGESSRVAEVLHKRAVAGSGDLLARRIEAALGEG